MYEEIRKYAIKLSETSPAHQIRIVELLEKVGEKVCHATRVRVGKGGDSSGYFRYDRIGNEWCITSQKSKTIIDSAEFIERLERYLRKVDNSASEVEVGAVYINSVGAECMIESIAGKTIGYLHQNGCKYTTSVSNIEAKWKLKSIKKDPNVFKYKPGDKVKIRTDLSLIKAYKMQNSDKKDSVIDSMLFYKGQVATIDCIASGKYRLAGIDNSWTDEMFEGLAEETDTPSTLKVGDIVRLKADADKLKDSIDLELLPNMRTEMKVDTKINEIHGRQAFLSNGFYYELKWLELIKRPLSKVPKYLDRPVQIGDYVERVEKIEFFLQKSDSTINKVVAISPTGLLAFKNNKGFYSAEFFKVINRLHPSHPDFIGKDVEKAETIEAKQPLKEEIKINQKSEKTKMATKKTLKETTVTTVGQNKEALIIASKMEAGRILTKQVLKQVKPHVPMLLRGYLDTPLAPVVLANAVAMIGNHTENKRVQQVAELMLLSAASDTVGSFNLDKIIDDVLSGVKLPAGVLDGDNE